MHRPRRWVALVILPFLLAGCRAETPGAAGEGPTAEDPSHTPARPSGTVTGATATTPRPSPTVPRPDHIVVVVFENRDQDKVMGSPAAPYLNELAASGANLTQSYGVTYPSQPNYLALFSGSTQGVKSNDCPKNFPKADNLGHQLLVAGLSFIGYAESLPSVGFRGCESGRYERKHNPWVNFGNLPASVNQPFSAFPTDFASLPTVAYVTPNMCNDMHDCSVATGDAYLANLVPTIIAGPDYQQGRLAIVVVFDENAGASGNQVYCAVISPFTAPGTQSATNFTHYSLLRTTEEILGVPFLGNASGAASMRAAFGL